jgi:hypothetical protein
VAELDGGEDVETLVAHEGGGASDRIKGSLDLGPDTLLSLAPARRRSRRLCGAGKVEEVGALRVVELERAGQRFQHALRNPAHVSALEAGVVRNALAEIHGGD